jgi:hypothetical protein
MPEPTMTKSEWDAQFAFLGEWKSQFETWDQWVAFVIELHKAVGMPEPMVTTPRILLSIVSRMHAHSVELATIKKGLIERDFEQHVGDLV